MSSSIPKDDKYLLLGYVIVPGEEGVARLLYEGWRITQNWFPIGQCLEHCIECGVTDPKVYTQEEFLKLVPRVSIEDLDPL